jgi:hypothetical protein
MNTWIEAIIHQASRMPRTYGLVVLVLPVHIADKHGMQMIAASNGVTNNIALKGPDKQGCGRHKIAYASIEGHSEYRCLLSAVVVRSQPITIHGAQALRRNTKYPLAEKGRYPGDAPDSSACVINPAQAKVQGSVK